MNSPLSAAKAVALITDVDTISSFVDVSTRIVAIEPPVTPKQEKRLLVIKPIAFGTAKDGGW